MCNWTIVFKNEPDIATTVNEERYEYKIIDILWHELEDSVVGVSGFNMAMQHVSRDTNDLLGKKFKHRVIFRNVDVNWVPR